MLMSGKRGQRAASPQPLTFGHMKTAPSILLWKTPTDRPTSRLWSLRGFLRTRQVSVSTEDFTKDPVTVTVNSQAYTLGVEESSLPEGTVIEGNGTGRLVLTVPENGSISVYYALDKDPVAAEDRKSITVAIDNIYNKEILPAVVWDYYETVVPAEGGEQDEVKLETVAYGEARAVLVDENGSELIDPRTGTAPVYVFVPGGETEYTFSGYVNQYGMKGEDFTVTLPVTLLPYPGFCGGEGHIPP